MGIFAGNKWFLSYFSIQLVPFFNTEGKESVTEAFCSSIELSKFRLWLSSFIVTAAILYGYDIK